MSILNLILFATMLIVWSVFTILISDHFRDKALDRRIDKELAEMMQQEFDNIDS